MCMGIYISKITYRYTLYKVFSNEYNYLYEKHTAITFLNPKCTVCLNIKPSDKRLL